MKDEIKKIVGEIDKSFGPKKKIVLPKSYFDEFRATKTYQNGQNWYNSIKMSNSYAEAKQHNLV